MKRNDIQSDKRGKKKKGLRTPGEILDAYVPDLPVKSAAKLTRTIMRLSTMNCPARFHYGFDKREMKDRPVLILAQHASRNDPYYVNAGYPFVQPNAVMSLHNVLIPVMFRLLLADGVILKSLFEPDIGAMRQLMRLHKKGASFLIFPEGVQSMDGTTMPVHPATARLVKKLGMDTVLCTSHGAYLCNPRFDTNRRKGRLEYSFDMIFTKEELKEITEEELYSRLLEKFRYNDFAWNSEKQFRYSGKVPCAHGIDNMLFVCPRCGKQFSMHVEGDRLLCSCGSAVTIDDRYNLIPDDSTDFPFRRIDEWYRWQQDVISEEVKQEDFVIREDAIYRVLNTENLMKGRCVTAGEGQLVLDREHLRYTGTKNGEKAEMEFEISKMPSATVSTTMDNQFYYDGEYYQFSVKGGRGHAVKLMMAVEALHDMGDAARSKARDDVREDNGKGA